MKHANIFLVIIIVLAAAGVVQAKTKYVAPTDIETTMQSFTAALGVTCEYCHVNDRAATLKEYKWANETEFGALRHKRVAQAMLGMQIAVNK
nr:hypothetical protein [Desulfobacterales bacterium]